MTPAIDDMKAAIAFLNGWPDGLSLTWRWHTRDCCYMLTSTAGSVSFGAPAAMDCQVVEMDGLSGASQAELSHALEVAHTALCVTTAEDRLHNLWKREQATKAKLARLRGACRRIYTRGHRRGMCNGWTEAETGDEFLNVIGPMLEAS